MSAGEDFSPFRSSHSLQRVLDTANR